MLVPLASSGTLPFVADLIKEESMPFAFFIVSAFGTIGLLLVSVFSFLVSFEVINYKFAYIFIGCMGVVYFILILFGMKDVINEKAFDIRRERSDS